MSERMAMPVQTGEVIDYTNAGTEAINVGDVVVMGSFCGVAEDNIDLNATGAVAITKVWEVAAVSGAPFVVGDLLYWDPTAKKATKTATSNKPLGVCIAAKSSGATKARVKIGLWFVGA